jgi:hypothetical protein
VPTHQLHQSLSAGAQSPHRLAHLLHLGRTLAGAGAAALSQLSYFAACPSQI